MVCLLSGTAEPSTVGTRRLRRVLATIMLTRNMPAKAPRINAPNSLMLIFSFCAQALRLLVSASEINLGYVRIFGGRFMEGASKIIISQPFVMFQTKRLREQLGSLLLEKLIKIFRVQATLEIVEQ